MNIFDRVFTSYYDSEEEFGLGNTTSEADKKTEIEVRFDIGKWRYNQLERYVSSFGGRGHVIFLVMTIFLLVHLNGCTSN